MTRTLVTNDDGITSPGLHALAAAAIAEGHDVTIAAPLRQSSGSSASITAYETDGRIRMERREMQEFPGVPVFAVRGAPGLIALIAEHGAFGASPDVVLSGINHGANVGRAVLHSGTVGAALTGGLNGARGLAISLDVGFEPEAYAWDVAAAVARSIIPFLLEQAAGTVINLNVPNAVTAPEVRTATLAPFGIVQTTMSERGDHFVRLTVEDLPHDPQPGSDAALLAAGFATITSISAVTELPMAAFFAPSRANEKRAATRR